VPVLRLYPANTVPAEFPGIGVVGAASAHAALADASDASYVVLQLTSAEPDKWWRGELDNRPDGAGVVVGVVINVRVNKDDPPGSEFAFLRCGDFPNNRLTDLVPNTITDFATTSLTDLDVAEVNAAQWKAGAEWDSGSVVNVNIYQLNFDVDFNFVIGGGVAMIFQLLGPLVAVGLHEMPRLGLELFRRHGLRMRPEELRRAWLEMREHTSSRRVFLGA
jgi:hypothetical protein